jgi:hypothetical protein
VLSKREITELSRATPKKVRVAVVVAVLVATLIGVYAYVVPASDAAQAAVDDRPGVAHSATLRPWSDGLSQGAVDSGGIENDLDGNASALVPSDCIGLSACRDPRQL